MDVEKFSTVPLFENIAASDIAKILEIGKDIIPRKGETICREAEKGEGFYIIASGAFDVIKKDGEQQKVIARLSEMSHFGEMSLVTEAPHSAAVVCVEDGRLKKIPADRFRAPLEAENLTAYRVVLNMSRMMAIGLQRAEKIGVPVNPYAQ